MELKTKRDILRAIDKLQYELRKQEKKNKRLVRKAESNLVRVIEVDEKVER